LNTDYGAGPISHILATVMINAVIHIPATPHTHTKTILMSGDIARQRENNISPLQCFGRLSASNTFQ
jgi:hypothetical protein